MALRAGEGILDRPWTPARVLETLADADLAASPIAEWINVVSDEEFESLPAPIVRALTSWMLDSARLSMRINDAVKEAARAAGSEG